MERQKPGAATGAAQGLPTTVPSHHLRDSVGSQEAIPLWVSGQGSCDLRTAPTWRPLLYGPVTHMTATEQAEGVTEGHRGRGTLSGHCLVLGAACGPRRMAGLGCTFSSYRDSEEDTELSCARGGCLARRVTSCSCELLTEGRWGQSWLE